MKLFKVTEKSGNKITYSGNDLSEFDFVSFGHGKPERWVLHKDHQLSEVYNDADVIAEEEREAVPALAAVVDEQGVEIAPAVPAVMQKWVQLKAEYTVEIEDITAQVAQEAINAEALAYLAATDWMIIREVDAGVACPAEVKAERAAARARIVR